MVNTTCRFSTKPPDEDGKNGISLMSWSWPNLARSSTNWFKTAWYGYGAAAAPAQTHSQRRTLPTARTSVSDAGRHRSTDRACASTHKCFVRAQLNSNSLIIQKEPQMRRLRTPMRPPAQTGSAAASTRAAAAATRSSPRTAETAQYLA